MKGPSSHSHSRRKKRSKGDTDQLAAQLAPLEEQDRLSAERQLGLTSTQGEAGRTPGAIVVDSDYQGISKDLIEARDETRFFGMEPVVLVVLIIMLSFIAFITWQITLMPQ